jgi:hypothetical protein
MTNQVCLSFRAQVTPARHFSMNAEANPLAGVFGPVDAVARAILRLHYFVNCPVAISSPNPQTP